MHYNYLLLSGRGSRVCIAFVCKNDVIEYILLVVHWYTFNILTQILEEN